MKDVYIKLENIPSFNDESLETRGQLPTEAEVFFGQNQGIDNQTPLGLDPAIWYIFDTGSSDDHPINPSTPTWMYYTSSGQLRQRKNPGGNFNGFTYYFGTCPTYETGGPRNKGYAEVTDSMYWRFNNDVPKIPDVRNPFEFWGLYNESWKTGSIEFTIRPTKENCTLLSGSLTGEGETILNAPKNTPGRQTKIIEVEDGIKNEFDPLNVGGPSRVSQQIEIGPSYGIVAGEEKAYPGGHITVQMNSGQGGVPPQFITFPDPSKGLTLTDGRSYYRSFKVDLVDGIIRVSYEVFYGPNKKYVEFFGKTNLVDGNWHHVVINRPNKFTLKTSEQQYEGDGCFEIWVDNNLEMRDFSIKTTDILPTPMVLFNDSLNAGVKYWNPIQFELKPDWVDDEIKKTNYTGGIRDFVFRQSIALSPHMINLNYIYSMINDDSSRIVKAKTGKAQAKIIQPTITTSKPKILKLYWNNLLNDKTKNLNGLEFDETYNVYSYSMTHKNLLSPTQTFNLDLNPEEKQRQFFKNVRAAVGTHMFIPYPGLLMSASTAGLENPSKRALNGSPLQIDSTDDSRVLNSVYPYATTITNLLFGGVYLNPGDRVLLFGQSKKNENGIWIFNGNDQVMTRPEDIDAKDLLNGHVYVEQGKYANKTFVQVENVTHLRKSAQTWREIDSNSSLSTLSSYPIHTTPWADEYGNARFINVNTDIDFDYDIIAFMNFPTQNKEIVDSLFGYSDVKANEIYKDFVNNLKSAVNSGKSLYVSSPMLALDLGIVSRYVEVDQMLNITGDAQSASISPFESGEPASAYFDTHRNNKHRVATVVPGLTNKQTYTMSDFVTYSPDRINSDYHIKYNYRQFGLQEGDEFIIPGLTTVPETLNGQLPGYLYNQRGTAPLAAFPQNSINLGVMVTKFSNLVYNGATLVTNPYNDYATTIAATYGSGKIFVNCVENGYAFSRSDYNTGLIQNVTAGQNSETVQTAAWQYSTKRLNKQNLYDFSEISNLIGQTTPTTGGGGAIVQSQSHCSNGLIRKKTNQGDLQYQSDLYTDATEEIFTTTQIPVLSMTWLGLQWLAE